VSSTIGTFIDIGGLAGHAETVDAFHTHFSNFDSSVGAFVHTCIVVEFESFNTDFALLVINTGLAVPAALFAGSVCHWVGSIGAFLEAVGVVQ
jgi:hypothetical protein